MIVNRNSLAMASDVLVAPAVAAQSIRESPNWLLPAATGLLLTLCGDFMSLHNQMQVARGWTVVGVLETAALLFAGNLAWTFAAFYLVGVYAGVLAGAKKAFALSCHASIALIGVPTFVQGLVIALAEWHAGGPVQHTQLLLPSIGWLYHGPLVYQSLLSTLNIFAILQIFVCVEFLRGLGMGSAGRWLLGIAIAVLPQTVWAIVNITFVHSIMSR